MEAGRKTDRKGRRYQHGVSRVVPCSALMGETVPDSLPAQQPRSWDSCFRGPSTEAQIWHSFQSMLSSACPMPVSVPGCKRDTVPLWISDSGDTHTKLEVNKRMNAVTVLWARAAELQLCAQARNPASGGQQGGSGSPGCQDFKVRPTPSAGPPVDPPRPPSCTWSGSV